ncbi:DUF2079 domain-containing protein [Thermococcus sp.]|uniref:DUF2079 domain-containing protein n=1 Tax=Thermococcus sp. TaxID=35749 RepID=UPI002633D4FE|nr:DUF2079 domain-containing protein [Thermococcus sp.]
MKIERTVVWLLIAVYTLVFSIISINHHYTFRTNAFDLGIFMQSLWNTFHGRFMYNTVEYFVFCAKSHFNIHLSPILLVVLPLYHLLPEPQGILILQTLALGMAAYPLFLLSQRVLKRTAISLGIVLLYLCNSLLHGINTYDFHAVSLAVPFIFLTAYFMETQRFTLALFAAVITLSTREDAGIAVVSLGIFYLLRNVNLNEYLSLFEEAYQGKLSKDKFAVLSMIVLGGLWVILGFFIVNSGHLISFYTGPFDLHLLEMKGVYFVIANLTVGMFLFLNPKYFLLLTSLPWMELLLSSDKNLTRIGLQYPYMLVPLSFVSAVYILGRIEERELRKIFFLGVSLGLLISLVTTPVLPFQNGITGILEIPCNCYQPITPHDKVLSQITSELAGTNLSVLTQNDIFPHLANRDNTYVIWVSYCNNTLPFTDVILLDWTKTYSMYNFFIADRLKYYRLVYSWDGIEVWIRKGEVASYGFIRENPNENTK